MDLFHPPISPPLPDVLEVDTYDVLVEPILQVLGEGGWVGGWKGGEGAYRKGGS